MKKVSLFALGICLWLGTSAQSEMKTNQGFLFSPSVSFHTPTADLSDRFTRFNGLGMQVDYLTKSKWMLGVDYQWIFGDGVKTENLLTNLRGTSGILLDENGNFVTLNPSIRGNYGTLNVSRIISLGKAKSNSGIMLSAGAGALQYRIEYNALQTPQLNEEYVKGYDKLTFGFTTRQFIGYQYLELKNKIHVRAGIEFNQGFLQGRRTWDFDTNSSGLDKRMDNSYAFKLGIIVPVYTKSAQDEEFFID